ncbi:MAG: helix-turn-helix transcriptional regulator [Richelia sp. RM2_1_2]|nr:helix-turn-helix transcriptional regulator [Richelia sp. RM2_1_2]
MQKTAIELKHQKIFDEMFRRFNISAKDLAQEADVSEATISRFRQSKSDLTALNLIKLILLVPPEARSWYLSQVFGISPGTNWQDCINQASPQELAEILRIVADKYAQSNIRETTVNVEESKAV